MDEVYSTKLPEPSIGNDLGALQKSQFQHEDWGLMEPIFYAIDDRRVLPCSRGDEHIPVSAKSFVDSQCRLVRSAAKMTHLERLRILSIVEGNIFGWFEEQLCKYRPDHIEEIMMTFVDLLERWTEASKGAGFPIVGDAFASPICTWRRKDRKIVVLDRNRCGLKQGLHSKSEADLLLRAQEYKKRTDSTRNTYFETGGNRLAVNGNVLGSVQIVWMPDEILNDGFEEHRWVRIVQDRSPIHPLGYRYTIIFSDVNDALMDRLIMRIHGTVSDRSKYLPVPKTPSLLLESTEVVDGIPVEALARTPIWARISDYLRDQYQRETNFVDIDVGFYIENRFGIDFFFRLHDEASSTMGLVDAIWITIYRTDERHWGALLRKWACALKCRLHVFVELTASSEADRNYHLADDLMNLGADVKVAVPSARHTEWETDNFDLKVHAKVLRMHTMDVEGTERDLLVVSTGNFNELAQSKFHDTYYMQYRSCETGDPFPDATAFFEFLWTGNVNPEYAQRPFAERKLFFLPGEIREGIRQDIKGITRITLPKEHYKLLEEVEAALGTAETEEPFDTKVIQTAEQMRPFVFIKTNHLTDSKVLKYLRNFLLQNPANMVYAIVRTTMGAENLMEFPNFVCRTVMGSYLEHDRYFFTGMIGARTVESLYREANLNPEDVPSWKTLGRKVPIPVENPNSVAITSAYVMSADLMERNLSRRVECMARLSPGMAETMLRKMQALFNLSSQPEYGIFNEPLTGAPLIEGGTMMLRQYMELFNGDNTYGLF